MTPDLDALERAALAASDYDWGQVRARFPDWGSASPADIDTFSKAASPSVVLALVREVRELRARLADHHPTEEIS